MHQGLPRNSTLHEILPAAVAEDPLDKILPERRIAEPPFLLDWNQRKLLNKGPRKQSNPVPVRYPMVIVNTNPFHTAARRILFKHIPRQVQLLEFLDTIRGHALDRTRMISSTLDGHEPWMLGITNQSHRFPGRA